MSVIGIDPGKKGGIVSISETGIRYFFIPKIANEIDVRELNKILHNLYPKVMGQEMPIVVIEKVHALYGSAAGATFEFGRICGLLEGVIVANGFKYFMVQPKEWQKEMFQGVTPIYKVGVKRRLLETKKMAELAYKRLFPEIDFYITEKGNESKKVHDGLVDAILIAEYGRRKFRINE